jgi:site-specific DNA recombinase
MIQEGNFMKWVSNRAIGILRKSSKRQDGNSSFEIQEKEIREYCKNEGLELVEVWEIVESAKDDEKRKKYERVLKHAADQKILHHVYYMHDREARNMIDNARNEKRIKSGEIVLHYARERKVLDKETSGSEFFVRDINAAAASQFSRNLSEKVKDAMKQKADSGWFPSNHVPLGYIHRRSRDESGREIKGRTEIKIDTNAARVKLVRREFELRAQGMSFEEIRRTILDEGLIVGANVKAYYVSAIARRLSNKFYRGYFDWDGIEYLGKHPLIIPQTVLDVVQGNGSKRGWKKKERGVFSGGWLRCADPACGCALVYDGKKKKLKSTGAEVEYHYYRCTNAKKVHVDRKGKNMSEAELFEQFKPVFKALAMDKNFAEQIKSAMDELKAKHLEANQKKHSEFRNALGELDKEQDNAYADMKKGVIDEKQYQRLNLKIKENRSYYLDLIEQCSHSIIESHGRKTEKIIELAMNAESLWNSRNAAEKVAMLKRVVSNPVLDGINIRFDLQKPFAVIAKMNGNENWRPRILLINSAI